MRAERFIKNAKERVPMVNTMSGVKVRPGTEIGESCIMSNYADLYIVVNRFEIKGENNITAYFNNMPICRIEPSRYVEYDPGQEGFE